MCGAGWDKADVWNKLIGNEIVVPVDVIADGVTLWVGCFHGDGVGSADDAGSTVLTRDCGGGWSAGDCGTDGDGAGDVLGGDVEGVGFVRWLRNACSM